jgi:phytoene synthase
MYQDYPQDLSFCKKIHKKYGKSFYAGTLFLLPEERDATFVLYAFFRFPDEYVDTYYKDQKAIALVKISEWNDAWHKCYRGEDFQIEESEKKILRATAYIFHTFNIPFEYSQAFLQAMIQDTWKERYETYQELQEYMFGSASVVGLMMTYIFCSKDIEFFANTKYREEVLQKAKTLGEAFQMTNFLRDIGEDYAERGRIYIPQEDMQKFDVKENDIKNKKITAQFVELMKFEINRTQLLYKEADVGIGFLPKKASRGVYIARVLYSKILEKITAAQYDTLSARRGLGSLEKNYIALKTLIIFK